jgi:hypothetical protein
MSNDVYVASNWGAGGVGNKTGVRTKFFDHEWNPPQFEIPTPPDEVFKAFQKRNAGIPLQRNDYPEAAAVWNGKAFAKKGDLTAIGGFYAVRGELAEVLQRFDLGEGGLIPIPLFKDDLITPWPEPVWWVNFGVTKGCFVPEDSKGVELIGRVQGTWSFNGSTENDMIAVTPRALEGSSVWVERGLLGEIFMLGDLMRALTAVQVKPKLHFSRVRIVGGDQ